MKKLATLVLLSLLVVHSKAQSEITVIQSIGNDAYYATGMSSDGEYITGQVGNQHHLFVWKKARQ